MVRSVKTVLQKRREKSRQALLQRLEGELNGIYDLIHQVFSDEKTSLEVLQQTLKRAMSRSSKEQYEKYLKLWVFRLTVECIQRRYSRFFNEKLDGQFIPFAHLSLEEKLILLLNDRANFTFDEIAAVMQVPVGRVGRSLTYAREKTAKELFAEEVVECGLTLLERSKLNQNLRSVEKSKYILLMEKVHERVNDLPTKRFSEIEQSVRINQILPILGKTDVVRWHELPWQYKLGLEASVLGLVGLFAVVVMPWAFSKINADAFIEGRFTEMFQVSPPAISAPEVEEVTAERLLASTESADKEKVEETDEFADTDFPSGDYYEVGSAPAAPSKQQAPVYRLIVQSPSPQELIPYVRSVFAQKNVKERDSSGRVMPGGVYFDGITNVATYPQILQEIQKVADPNRQGFTKTYSNPNSRNNPNERARVIVWVQQI